MNKDAMTIEAEIPVLRVTGCWSCPFGVCQYANAYEYACRYPAGPINKIFSVSRKTTKHLECPLSKILVELAEGRKKKGKAL